jgi:hypothetical protein
MKLKAHAIDRSQDPNDVKYADRLSTAPNPLLVSRARAKSTLTNEGLEGCKCMQVRGRLGF